MPETSGVDTILGPDYFGYYKSEVKDLLSQDDSLLPSTHLNGNLHGVGKEKKSSKNSSRTQKDNTGIDPPSLFSNGIGAMLSESKKERLKLLLRQSVSTLTQEVDEMINPVLSVCRIRSCLICKESLLSSDASISKDDQSTHHHKKHKALPACKDLESEDVQRTRTQEGLPNKVVKKCIECLATRSPQWRPAPDGTKSLCNACGLRKIKAQKNGSINNSDIKGAKENVELDEDLRIILENDSTKVEELMKIHSSEISATLHHMERNLEELLNAVMTSCRAMTHAEKRQLCELIEKLPPKYLTRVAEIMELDRSSDEVHVELDQMVVLDNVTLWRLYFYVATIKSANVV